jgi:hypothetical protein
MPNNYKLDRIRDLADGDEDFVAAIATAFLEEVPVDANRLKLAVPNKDYKETYQAAHKMKPTIDLFGLSVFDQLIEIQDWGKYEQTDKDITEQLNQLLVAIENTVIEIRKDFGL